MGGDIWDRSENWFVLYILLFWAFALLEFMIMFSGSTMFSNQVNLVQIAIHVGGVFALVTFMRVQAHYVHLVPICAATSLLQFLIEAVSAINSKMNYRRSSGSGRT